MSIDDLAVRPPVAPMLARLRRDMPIGDYVYEPKWDGFRAIVFRDGADVEIQSRHGRPFARYFPDVVAAACELDEHRIVIDGEILVIHAARFEFERLMLRTHPAASRVAALSEASPATFVAFDLLARGDRPLLHRPFIERRSMLEQVLGTGGAVRLTPATRDVEVAKDWLRGYPGGGVDGVMAKAAGAPYEPGKRAMLKVKLERTADCVVAGLRLFPDGAVASLLLGLYDGVGPLRHVGVCSAFTTSRRFQLARELAPRVVPLRGHPWESGFGLEPSPMGRLKGAAGRWQPGMTMDWIPVLPLAAEVAYTALDGNRLRHPAQFRRWRPDREPRSCGLDQLSEL